MEETQEQTNNRPWLYKKGQSGNPGGRPKGSKSMKTWVKERLETMTDEEREVFLDGLPKVEIWKLAEGNPSTENDLNVKGELKIEISEDIAKKYDTPSEPKNSSTE
jgi:hypothetical protein